MRVNARPSHIFVLGYLAVGAAWLVGSDYLLAAVAPDIYRFIEWSGYEDWILLLVSGGLLYYLMNRSENRQRAAQDALSEEQHRWQAAFEQSTIGVAQVLPSGRFMAANQALCNMLGYTEDELYTMTLGDVTQPSGRRKRQITDQVIHLGVRSLSLEQQLITRSNEPIQVRVTASLIAGSNGRPDYFVVFLEDVTDRG